MWDLKTIKYMNSEKGQQEDCFKMVTTTTPVVETKPDFKHAMFKFCKRLTETNKTYTDRFKHIDSVVFAPDKGGSRFVKVKYWEDRISTDYDENGTMTKTLVKAKRGSIHCFVEKETGNVYKPAGWRAPYTKGKNAVRGNIYDLSCIPDNANMCGGWLYII